MNSTILSSIPSLTSKELKSSQFFLYKEKNITKAELLLTKYYEEQQDYKLRLEKEMKLERELLAASNSLAMPLGIYLTVYLSNCLSIYLTVYLSMYLTIFLFIYLGETKVTLPSPEVIASIETPIGIYIFNYLYCHLY
jgi:hypothetical protein